MFLLHICQAAPYCHSLSFLKVTALSASHTHTLTLPLAFQHGHSFTETQWSILGFQTFICTDLQWTKCARLQFTTLNLFSGPDLIYGLNVKLRAFVWDFSIRMFFIECHCVLSIFVCVGTKRSTLTALISPVSETMNLVFPSRLNSFSLLPGAFLQYTMGSKIRHH